MVVSTLRRGAGAAAAALVLALAAIDPKTTGPCAICEHSVPLGQLRPILPGWIGVVVCALCSASASPPGPVAVT